MDWVDKPQNYKDFCGILQLLRGSLLNNVLLKTFKLAWVAFHSVTFQLKCLDFQCNQDKKFVPVLSRFCNRTLSIYINSAWHGGLEDTNKEIEWPRLFLSFVCVLWASLSRGILIHRNKVAYWLWGDHFKIFDEHLPSFIYGSFCSCRFGGMYIYTGWTSKYQNATRTPDSSFKVYRSLWKFVTLRTNGKITHFI